MARTHEPGEAHFQSILPEAIEWEPFPAFPPEARLAGTCRRAPKAGTLCGGGASLNNLN